MTRTAMPQLDSFDPEVLDAARDVAARAGVPLETWIASVVPQSQSGAQSNRRQRRRLRAEQLDRPIARPEGIADRIETRQVAAPAQAVIAQGVPAQEVAAQEVAAQEVATHETQAKAIPAARPAPIAATYGDGIAALMNRLDGLDRALDADRRDAQIIESKRLAEIEARIERALKGAPVQQVTERLGDIERRMSQLGEQVAATRQPGRRARPAAADIRNAVQDIRQRQRELSQAVAGDAAAPAAKDGGVVASMRLDLARRLEARSEDATAPAIALAELQHETVRLRAAIQQLATSHDVGALEQAVTALADRVEAAHAGSDLAAIAAPIEEIRARIEILAEEIAENVHARVAEDVRLLAERLAGVAASGQPGSDGPTLAGLFAELSEIRHLIEALAGPERIQSLADSLEAISAEVAKLQQTGIGSDLRPMLEEIRDDLKIAAPAVLAEQIQTLADKVDTLGAREESSEPSREGDSAQPGEIASIHAMLHNLAEKVDQVGTRSEHEGLDALESQVVTLAGRLDAPHGVDPSLVGLERTMSDLLQQVAALREAAPSEAVVERAARNAVAQTLSGSGIAAETGEIGLLRASLADMQARQAASDQRLGATLEGVQTALERLLVRLGPVEAVDPRAPSLGERLMSSTSPEVALAPADLSPAARRDAGEAPLSAEDLLEPGSGRPQRGGREAAARKSARDRQVEPARTRPTVEPAGDIKTSFIAAARRAAQAAQAELAAEGPTERRDTRAAKASAPQAAGEPGRLDRLRSEMDRRRRPLLLGLAAIVLALGALQAVKLRPAEESRPVAAASQIVAARSEPAGDAAKVGAKVDEASKEPAKDAAKDTTKEAAKDPAAEGWKDAPAAKAPVIDPTTTQALPSPVAAEARTKSALPQVAGMNTLQADLGGLPPSLAKVKAAALEGDGTAVWDLATREAEGRGVARDLPLAAKLFEKLASAGFAPAQYKIAGQYEKGAGVVRDLDKAKLWYGRAAEQGHARSMHNLAVIFAENPAANGKPDFVTAATWFRQGAEFGVRDSQYNLGVLYARGMGIAQDLVQSYVWFAAAAAQGDEDAAKKRDDVANKLSTSDLASAKSLAGAFKPRKIDAAVNEPPVLKPGATAPMSLLGAPAPSPVAFTAPPRRT